MNRSLLLPPYAALLLVLLAAPAVLAQAPGTLAYQGLLEQGGTPVNDPNATLTFRLYDALTGGAELWEETQTGVVVNDGVFNVALGAMTAIPNTLFDGPLFLSVAIGDGAATELSPRSALHAAPYARTLVAPAHVVGSPANGVSLLRVDNTATSGFTYAVRAENNSNEGGGVLGQATSASGFTNGVRGISFSEDGHGVHGVNLVDTWECVAFEILPCGIGVFGRGPYGVWGEGVPGPLFGGAGVVGNGGVRGLSGTAGNASSGVAGYGEAENTTGVVGVAGLYGNGVEGISHSIFGISHGYGVFGVSYDDYDGGELSAGVYGRAAHPDVAWAGYFEGDIYVTGSVGRAGGSIQIDHPLDPENRVLQHSSVESPDMKTVYDGNVTTDARGYATVALPEYFEALNRDFRYQLTVIGQTFAQAIVAEEIRGNRFVIRTSEPGVRVSWQVTGIRQDAWAEANRFAVEEDKRPEDRGRYLHPAAFGQPRERWVDYDPVRAAIEAERLEEHARVEEAHARRREALERQAQAEAEQARQQAPPPRDR